MPCLLGLLALLIPRVVIILVWLFSHWFTGIFATWLIPVVGFLVLPTSLLWFSAVQNWWGGVWSFWPVVGMVIAVMIDLSPSGARRRRRWF